MNPRRRGQLFLTIPTNNVEEMRIKRHHQTPTVIVVGKIH